MLTQNPSGSSSTQSPASNPSAVPTTPTDASAGTDGSPADAVSLQPVVRPPSRRPGVIEIALACAGVAAVAVAMFLGTSTATPTQAEDGSPDSQKALVAVEMPVCVGTQAQPATASIGDPRARKAAQAGLDYLGRAATEWQAANNCYGCHVQAVTVEAIAVGIHHQYNVPKSVVQTLLAGMLDLNGGARQPGGLGHSSPEIGATGKLLGSAALARYDQWAGNEVSDYLLAEAQTLLSRQGTDGRVPMPWTSQPVATGDIQATAHAVVTWKQAYERSADDRWLTAVSLAEAYLRTVVAGFRQSPPASIQEMNYALMGLVAAGLSRSDEVVVALARDLLARQLDDGGWALMTGGSSEAFATGQALYVLRLLGYGDSDTAVARGTAWLMQHQSEDGSWSHAGFGKAEAMWAVLGLVSIDVMSVDIAGIEHGQRVDKEHAISVSARDNGGGGVRQIELYVDDIRVAAACGDKLAYTVGGARLATGKHVIEVRAQNQRGEVSRRFIDTYAGDIYITQIGTRFREGTTEISLRNITPEGQMSRVSVDIFATKEESGAMVPTDKLHTLLSEGRPGPMSVSWTGPRTEQPKAADGKTYVARLSVLDAQGKVVQHEDIEFIHDSEDAQRRDFAQLEGALALPGGDIAQNAMVELVDDKGQVLKRTVSTREGKYRFRNVRAKEGYKVRVVKDGFRASAPAQVKKGEEASVDMKLVAE